jgi:hypothetical protein
MGDLRKKIIAVVDAEGHVPEIGQTVYVLYEDCIFVEKVYSLGEKTFLLASFRANTKIDFWEWRYKDYGIRWFTTFESAEEELLSRYSDDYCLVGYESKWYEVERL